MVWNDKSPAIVMITKLVESGRTKCEDYLPKRSGTRYGSVVVQQTEDAHQKEGYVVRHLTLKVLSWIIDCYTFFYELMQFSVVADD